MRNPKFIGVFTLKKRGAKAGPIARGPFYFVWDLGNIGHAAQELDKALTPKGRPVLLDKAQFRNFQFEPSILAAPMSTPDFRHLQGAGAKPRAEDAEMRALERARKAKQLESDLRGNFQKAIRALGRPRDKRGALAALEQIASVTEGIVPAHKYMFRDFGVSLRKKNQLELALKCARRVVELSPDDDHAHFNVARILGMLGFYDQAMAHLGRAQTLDAHEPVYGRLARHIETLKK